MKVVPLSSMAIVFLLALGTAQLRGEEVNTSVKLSGKNISITYSAPTASGREIFGSLVPYGKVWPAGGTPAKLTTDVNLDIQGVAVPKGEYSLYLLPDQKAWQLIICKQNGPQAEAYDKKMDLGRVKMKVSEAGTPIETFKMTLTGRGLAGKIEVGWANTIASVSFFLDAVTKNSEWP